MSRAQTMDVINDTTTMQSRIDTVLASVQPEYDWSPEIEWWPGEPLYSYPRPVVDLESYSAAIEGNYVRPMFQVLNDLTALVGWDRCKPCEVYWVGDEPCFVCGAEDDLYKNVPRRIYNERLGQLESMTSTDEGIFARFTFTYDFESREQPSVGWVGQHIHGIVYDESSAFTVEPYRPPLLNREPFNQLTVLQDGWLDDMFRIPEVEPVRTDVGWFWGEPIIRIPRDRGKTPVPFPKGPIVIPNLPQHVRGDRHYLTSNVISQERRSRN